MAKHAKNTISKTTPRLTQTERAHMLLKRAILQGDIPEGVFLSENDIMRSYEIGRTPFREACNRLSREGLLEVIPRHGYLVPEISFRSVCDLFEMRLILEMASAELAALRAGEVELRELDRLASKPLPEAVAKSAFAAVIQANTDFHVEMAKATRNRELLEQLTRNLEKTERLQYMELRFSQPSDKQFQLQHGRIVSALRAHDPEAARQAVLDDIRDAQRATLNFGRWLPTASSGTVGPNGLSANPPVPSVVKTSQSAGTRRPGSV
jgi:GntR family transcriptional regulator, rspAB operon transcriptional repressor